MKALLVLALLASTPAFANFTYDCTRAPGSVDGAQRQTIEINGDVATVSFANAREDGFSFTATKDPKYKSRKGVAKARFNGREISSDRALIMDATFLSGAHSSSEKNSTSISGNLDSDDRFTSYYECSRIK